MSTLLSMRRRPRSILYVLVSDLCACHLDHMIKERYAWPSGLYTPLFIAHNNHHIMCP